MECQVGSPFSQSEQVSYISQNRNNPYSNSFNPGWRNHPNFLWRNNQSGLNPRVNHADVENKPDPTITAITDAIAKLATTQTEFANTTNKFINETRSNANSQAAEIRNLEIQVGQIAEKLNNRPPGSWPSNT